MNTAETKHIYFVRHGESLSNATGVSEIKDSPLTPKGEEQAKVVAERFERIKVDVVLSSLLVRAQKTGKHIANATGAPFLSLPGIHERETPSSTIGLPREERHKIRKLQAASWLKNEVFEDGESYDSLLKRASTLEKVLLLRPEKNIVVSGHGFFNRFFGLWVLLREDLTPHLFVERLNPSMPSTNTGVTYFTLKGTAWKLRAWNDHAHLG